MPETKHTPEPHWEYGGMMDFPSHGEGCMDIIFRHYLKIGGKPTLFSDTFTLDYAGMSDPLKRAADCVNACAGMEDPAREIGTMRNERRAREAGLHEITRLAADNHNLREIVAELARLAGDLIKRLRDEGNHGNPYMCRELVDCEAAIAKANAILEGKDA